MNTEHPKIRNINEVTDNTQLEDCKNHVSNLSEDIDMPDLFGIHKNYKLTSQKLMADKFIGVDIETI